MGFKLEISGKGYCHMVQQVFPVLAGVSFDTVDHKIKKNMRQ